MTSATCAHHETSQLELIDHYSRLHNVNAFLNPYLSLAHLDESHDLADPVSQRTKIVVVQHVFAEMVTQTSTTTPTGRQARSPQRNRGAHDPPCSSQSQANPSTSSSRVRCNMRVQPGRHGHPLSSRNGNDFERGVPLKEEVLVLAVRGVVNGRGVGGLHLFLLIRLLHPSLLPSHPTGLPA